MSRKTAVAAELQTEETASIGSPLRRSSRISTASTSVPAAIGTRRTSQTETVASNGTPAKVTRGRRASASQEPAIEEVLSETKPTPRGRRASTLIEEDTRTSTPKRQTKATPKTREDSKPQPAQPRGRRTSTSSESSEQTTEQKKQPVRTRRTSASSDTSEIVEEKKHPVRSRRRSNASESEIEVQPKVVRARRNSASDKSPSLEPETRTTRSRRGSFTKEVEEQPAPAKRTTRGRRTAANSEDSEEKSAKEKEASSTSAFVNKEEPQEQPFVSTPVRLRRRPSLTENAAILDPIDEASPSKEDKSSSQIIGKLTAPSMKVDLDLSIINESLTEEVEVQKLTSEEKNQDKPLTPKKQLSLSPVIRRSPRLSGSPDARRPPRLGNSPEVRILAKTGANKSLENMEDKTDVVEKSKATITNGMDGSFSFHLNTSILNCLKDQEPYIPKKDEVCNNEGSSLREDLTTTENEPDELNTSKTSISSDKENISTFSNLKEQEKVLLQDSSNKSNVDSVKEVIPARVSNVFRPKMVEQSFCEPMEVDELPSSINKSTFETTVTRVDDSVIIVDDTTVLECSEVTTNHLEKSSVGRDTECLKNDSLVGDSFKLCITMSEEQFEETKFEQTVAEEKVEEGNEAESVVLELEKIPSNRKSRSPTVSESGIDNEVFNSKRCIIVSKSPVIVNNFGALEQAIPESPILCSNNSQALLLSQRRKSLKGPIATEVEILTHKGKPKSPSPSRISEEVAASPIIADLTVAEGITRIDNKSVNAATSTVTQSTSNLTEQLQINTDLDEIKEEPCEHSPLLTGKSESVDYSFDVPTDEDDIFEELACSKSVVGQNEGEVSVLFRKRSPIPAKEAADYNSPTKSPHKRKTPSPEIEAKKLRMSPKEDTQVQTESPKKDSTDGNVQEAYLNGDEKLSPNEDENKDNGSVIKNEELVLEMHQSNQLVKDAMSPKKQCDEIYNEHAEVQKITLMSTDSLDDIDEQTSLDKNVKEGIQQISELAIVQNDVTESETGNDSDSGCLVISPEVIEENEHTVKSVVETNPIRVDEEGTGGTASTDKPKESCGETVIFEEVRKLMENPSNIEGEVEVNLLTKVSQAEDKSQLDASVHSGESTLTTSPTADILINVTADTRNSKNIYELDYANIKLNKDKQMENPMEVSTSNQPLEVDKKSEYFETSQEDSNKLRPDTKSSSKKSKKNKWNCSSESSNVDQSLRISDSIDKDVEAFGDKCTEFGISKENPNMLQLDTNSVSKIKLVRKSFIENCTVDHESEISNNVEGNIKSNSSKKLSKKSKKKVRQISSTIETEERNLEKHSHEDIQEHAEKINEVSPPKKAKKKKRKGHVPKNENSDDINEPEQLEENQGEPMGYYETKLRSLFGTMHKSLQSQSRNESECNQKSSNINMKNEFVENLLTKGDNAGGSNSKFEEESFDIYPNWSKSSDDDNIVNENIENYAITNLDKSSDDSLELKSKKKKKRNKHNSSIEESNIVDITLGTLSSIMKQSDGFSNSKMDEYLSKKLEELDDGTSEENYEEQESNEFLDNMAEEGEEDTPSEGSNDIIDYGESVGSSDSEIHEDEEYEEDSFVCDEEQEALLSGNEYDLGDEKKSRIISLSSEYEDGDKIVIPRKAKPSPEPKKRRRIISVSSDSSDEEVFLPEETINEAPVTATSPSKNIEIKEQIIRKRNSSIIIHENLSIENLQDNTLTERLTKVVKSFCSSVSEPNGKISLNLSLESIAPEGESGNVITSGKSIELGSVNDNKKDVASPNTVHVLEQQSLKDLSRKLSVCSPEESLHSGVSKNKSEDSLSEHDLKNIERKLSCSDSVKDISKSEKRLSKKRLSKSLEKLDQTNSKNKKLKASTVAEEPKQDITVELKKKKKNKNKAKKTAKKQPDLSPIDDLRTGTFNLMNQLITDVKNRPVRTIKPSSSVGNESSSWIIDTNDKDMKPSTTLVSKKDKKINYHPKDFKNEMLYGSKRVKRIDTKLLLKKKGA